MAQTEPSVARPGLFKNWLSVVGLIISSGGLFAFFLLFAIFELSGVRDHFNLEFIRDLILHHRLSGLALFVVLFSLGNLIQIPGWIFLAAAVLTLGRMWGGIVTYVAAVVSCAGNPPITS